MKSKSSWVLLLLLLSGDRSWRLYRRDDSESAGTFLVKFRGIVRTGTNPLVLNLGILVITFGLSIRITMASIIGVIVAILIYRFL